MRAPHRSAVPRPLPAVLLAFAASLAGCGQDGGGDLQNPNPEPAPVAEVFLSAPDSTLQAGATVQLTALARDTAGTVVDTATFTWASSNGAVATVSDDGMVTAVAEGDAEITATADGVTGTLSLTVSPAPPGPPQTVGLEEIATGVGFPLYVTSPPDDPRLFIVDKGGAIRVVKDGALLDSPFLDLSAKVSTRPEQGLLGMAFPPDYAASGRFLVHYTDVNGDTRVSFFRVSDDPDRADPASESVVLAVEQPGPSHNGGQLAFGPDGYLYIGLGDGGSRDGADRGRGQSLGDLFGSILRIDVSAGSPYVVPSDNPFVATEGARPEIWSYGFRNPWRFSFDRATGDLYVGDVGEHHWEEVDRATAADGAGRGLNYGWSRMEGAECLAAGCDRSGLTLPWLQYDHSQGCAVAGGYVYRGAALPSLQGQYFFADFCGGWVHSVPADGAVPPEPTDWPTLKPGAMITSFGEDTAGELYLTTADGRVLKIVPQ